MVKIKNHTSKIICSDSCFIVWYETLRCVASTGCWLESLTSMHECSLTVLSWHCFLTSRWSCVSIDIPVCPSHLKRLWGKTREQPNIFAAAYYSSYAHLDLDIVYFADVICWILMFWLERLPNSVFTYSKYRNANLPGLNMQFDIFSALFINTWSWLKLFCMTGLSCQTFGLYKRIHFEFG